MTMEKNQNVHEWAQNSAEIIHKTQKVMGALWKRIPHDSYFYDPERWQQAMVNYHLLLNGLMKNPQKLWALQFAWLQDYTRLWHHFACAWWGQPLINAQPIIDSAAQDKRFQHEEWENNPIFSYIKQAYLLTADYLTDLVYQVEGLDPKASKQMQFYTDQFINALAPSNFVLTNPQVLKTTMESAGANLVKGLENMLHDLEENEGRFKISMTDMDAFQVGKNLAITPGKVVFENNLFQLIQYSPSTKQVYEIPVVILPPWINKYYILDMKPENSFVKIAVDQGFTVFMVSWNNPGKQQADVDCHDFLLDGALAAIEAVRAITKQPKINIVGYCIGGTLLGCTLAYLAQKKLDVINSATFLAALLDFSEPGDIEVFIDEAQINALEKHMSKLGYLDGRDMALTFNTLRANDLIWSYFVNNYLQGQEPFAFDLLYWNNDATNLPAKAHATYLREFYLNNRLIEPGAIIIDGVPLDLNQVKVPVYAVTTEQDHITPWRSIYSGLQYLSGPKHFVLGGSGHIAGIINTPTKNKYGYRASDKLKENPEEWYETVAEQPGSWWTDWYQWLQKYSGKKINPPTMGNKEYPPLEDAPGSYVLKKVGKKSRES